MKREVIPLCEDITPIRDQESFASEQVYFDMVNLLRFPDARLEARDGKYIVISRETGGLGVSFEADQILVHYHRIFKSAPKVEYDSPSLVDKISYFAKGGRMIGYLKGEMVMQIEQKLWIEEDIVLQKLDRVVSEEVYKFIAQVSGISRKPDVKLVSSHPDPVKTESQRDLKLVESVPLKKIGKKVPKSEGSQKRKKSQKNSSDFKVIEGDRYFKGTSVADLNIVFSKDHLNQDRESLEMNKQ